MAEKPDRIRRDPHEADQAREAGQRGETSRNVAAHPVGTSAGAASGAAGGAAIGAAGGPAGMAAGAVLGGLIGGLAGNLIAQGVNPDAEHDYWRTNYRQRSYTRDEEPYEQYAPAYQYGWESYLRHAGGGERKRTFKDYEAQLGHDWDSHRGPNDLTWEHARHATRDAWERVHGTLAEARDRTPRTDTQPAEKSRRQ